MRRTLAAAILATGLLLLGACSGGKSTEEVCEQVVTEGAEAGDRLVSAGGEANQAMRDGDQLAALAAVGDAQGAADDLSGILRSGADDASDDELSEALATAADELDAFVDGLDVEALAEGEAPDPSGFEAAMDEVYEICDNA